VSEERPASLVFIEKIFGLILAVIGLILTYNTYLNLKAAGTAAPFFIATGVLLMILGLVLVISRAD